MKKNRLFTFIGKHSIVFYFFCGAVPVTLCALLSRFMNIQGATGLLAVFVISLVIAAVLSNVVFRWLPCLLDIRKVYTR